MSQRRAKHFTSGWWLALLMYGGWVATGALVVGLLAGSVVAAAVTIATGFLFVFFGLYHLRWREPFVYVLPLSQVDEPVEPPIGADLNGSVSPEVR